MDEHLGQIEDEEERILAEGGKLTGSMVGPRRIAVTRAIGDAWTQFSTNRAKVVRLAFRIVGLSLPLDGSADSELSIKGLANDLLVEGLKEWETGDGGGGGQRGENSEGGRNRDEGDEASGEMIDSLEGELDVAGDCSDCEEEIKICYD